MLDINGRAVLSYVLTDIYYDRELKVEDATTMLTDTLKWRQEFNINGLMEEQFPEEVFNGVGQVYGHDKLGLPVKCVPPSCVISEFYYSATLLQL